MADQSTSNDLGIRPVLFLGFLAATTPTALLIAYRADMDPVWHVPVAHTIIQLSIALLSLIIGTWLAQESRLNRHPALPVLSFFPGNGQAVGGTARDRPACLWLPIHDRLAGEFRQMLVKLHGFASFGNRPAFGSPAGAMEPHRRADPLS